MRKTHTALAAGTSTGEYGHTLAAGRADTIPNGIAFGGEYLIRLGGRVVAR